MNFWSRSYNFGLINDNQTIIRFNALIQFFSFGNYQIHNILFNLLSFTGLLAIWKFFKTKFEVKKWMLLLSLFLFPTVLLWTSGVLKESILIFALGFFLYFFFVKAKPIFASYTETGFITFQDWFQHQHFKKTFQRQWHDAKSVYRRLY